MFFVTENIKVSQDKWRETSIKKGGYGSITSAIRAAQRKTNCFIRDDKRNIVGQTINPGLPLYV